MDHKKENRNKQKKLNKDYRRNAPNYVSVPKPLPQTTTSEVINISDSNSDDGCKFSKRKIVSNRNKYEVDIKDEENQQILAGDFKTLLEKKSVGGHFQFNSEKQWETELEEINNPFQENFSLNINLITEGLSTIPFYKRHDYDISLFNEEDIIKMNEEAKMNEQNYKKVAEEEMMKTVKSSIKQPDHVIKCKDIVEKNSLVSDNSSNELQLLQKEVESIILGDNKENILHTTTTLKIPTVQQIDQNIHDAQKSDSVDDIQKWLDDVLND